MNLALDLARKGEGRTRPNPPVGAVVVRDGEVVGAGHHPRAGDPHAEVFALRQAGELARGADLYVTLEPCSHHGRTGPCAEALIAAGIQRVFVGCEDPNPQVAGRGIRRLREAGIEVAGGVLEPECRWLIGPFAKHVTTGLPLVVLKSAVTLDGKTATSIGDSQWISNSVSRAYVHQVRNRVDAVMVGIGTVLRDDPSLTTRLGGEGRDAVRVVVDSQLRIDDGARLLSLDSEAPTVIATTEAAPYGKIKRLRDAGVRILVLPASEGRVDVRALLKVLGEMELQSILLEGGAVLSGEFLRAQLIDRVMIFIAPKIIGGDDGKGIFAGCGSVSLGEAPRVENLRIRQFGDDLLCEGEVTYVHRVD